jgi:hypothetical protein
MYLRIFNCGGGRLWWRARAAALSGFFRVDAVLPGHPDGPIVIEHSARRGHLAGITAANPAAWTTRSPRLPRWWSRSARGGRQGTDTVILPPASPDSITRCASTMSAKPNTLAGLAW